MTCQRSLFDVSNDAYNHWRDVDDQPVRRETVLCTCGECPVAEVRHGGCVEAAESLYGYAMPR